MFEDKNLITQDFKPTHTKLIDARDGTKTLEVLHGEDKYLLHSKYRPLEESQRQIANLNYQLGDTLLFLGLGLAHTLKAIEDKIYSPTVVIIVEKDIEIFYRACQVYDLKKILTRPQTYLIIGKTITEFKALIHPHIQNWATIAMHTIEQKPSVQRYSSYYLGISQALKDEFFWVGTALKSAVELSQIEMKNKLSIAPWYFGSDSLLSFKNVFKGFNGLVVGAGPSLALAIPVIKKYYHNTVICCAGTALKLLLANDIIPHIVVTLDYHEFSSDYLAVASDLPVSKQPLLVIDPRANILSLQKWSGAVCFVPEPRTEWLVNNFDCQSPITTGSSVGVMAFTTLAYFGVDNISLVGMDLSSPYGVTYAPGLNHYDTGWPTLNRFSTYEMMEWERILRFRSELLTAFSYEDNKVYSDTVMLSFLYELEAVIAQYNSNVYDAGAGGLKKRGVQVGDLNMFLANSKRVNIKLNTKKPQKNIHIMKQVLKELNCGLQKAQACNTLSDLQTYLAYDKRLSSFIHFLSPTMVLQYNKAQRQRLIAKESGTYFNIAESEENYFLNLKKALKTLQNIL